MGAARRACTLRPRQNAFSNAGVQAEEEAEKPEGDAALQVCAVHIGCIRVCGHAFPKRREPDAGHARGRAAEAIPGHLQQGRRGHPPRDGEVICEWSAQGEGGHVRAHNMRGVRQQTSGGTVLSTNWKVCGVRGRGGGGAHAGGTQEVAEKDYEVERPEPPKGMEWHKWEQ